MGKIIMQTKIIRSQEEVEVRLLKSLEIFLWAPGVAIFTPKKTSLWMMMMGLLVKWPASTVSNYD